MIKDVIKTMVTGLVDHAEDIRVDKLEGHRTTVYELRVHPSDLGKVIGKKGKTAQAIRTIISSICAKNDERVVFEIIE